MQKVLLILVLFFIGVISYSSILNNPKYDEVISKEIEILDEFGKKICEIEIEDNSAKIVIDEKYLFLLDEIRDSLRKDGIKHFKVVKITKIDKIIGLLFFIFIMILLGIAIKNAVVCNRRWK